MSSGWEWDDHSCWQSCSPENKARAEQWMQERGALYERLEVTAAQQPLAGTPEQVKLAEEHAGALRAISERLVVIGTGGATLGGQALCALSEQPARVRFLENCDPITLAAFLAFDMQDTSWCIISKSGETVETLAAALALVGQYDAAALRARVRVVTTLQDSTLMRLATAQGWTVVPHPPTLGGRYSVFSVVGLLPAAFAGLSAAAIAESGAKMLQRLLQQKNTTLLSHAAWFAANMPEKPIHLLMGYADRLRSSTQWYKQLWAESLGKAGLGATPVTAIGAIDQHSQLQLYLDGPRDKLITLWLPQCSGTGALLPAVGLKGAEFLEGRRMGDVMHATAEATVHTMREAGLPLRVLRGELTPVNLASWMAWQMIETLMVAQLMGVDPYSQPAVEAGKKLTRAALAEVAV